jgi:hypothetical protein
MPKPMMMKDKEMMGDMNALAEKPAEPKAQKMTTGKTVHVDKADGLSVGDMVTVSGSGTVKSVNPEGGAEITVQTMVATVDTEGEQAAGFKEADDTYSA